MVGHLVGSFQTGPVFSLSVHRNRIFLRQEIDYLKQTNKQETKNQPESSTDRVMESTSFTWEHEKRLGGLPL